MLFVLSLLGYPIDGLTQSTVMAVQGVLRDNKFLMTGAAEVALVVALLVWACAAYQALNSGLERIHDDIRPHKSRLLLWHAELPQVATVNSGGR